MCVCGGGGGGALWVIQMSLFHFKDFSVKSQEKCYSNDMGQTMGHTLMALERH